MSQLTLCQLLTNDPFSTHDLPKKYVKCTLPFISRSGDLYRRLGDSDCTACIREILGYSRKLGIGVLIGSRIKT